MKNFSKNVIPMHQIGFPIQVPFIPCEDDSVKLLFEVTEGLNYTKLYETYSTLGRNPAVNPVILFRVLIYGYMNKLYSSREIERACKRYINFMWLLQGQKTPAHNTIARFRTDRLTNCLDDLFNQFIIKLGEINEIAYENIFIDGTKIEANANKYTFVWKKATDKFENKLQEKIKIILEEITSIFEINIGKIKTKVTINRVKRILNRLDDIKPQNYEKFKKDISKKENMTYNHDEDVYICAFGKKLVPVGTKEKQSKLALISKVTIYECFEYSACPYKDTCTKANRRFYVSKNFIKYHEKSHLNISTPKGKLLRMNHSIQVEGAFGVLKQDYSFRRFLVRGKKI